MKKFSKETIVGVFVVIGIICVVYMTVTLGKLNLFSNDYYTLKARFNTVAGLRAGNYVSMLGINIGTIKGFELDQEDQVAVVTMTIRKDIIVYEDAMASVKTEGLIGDKYISIYPGGGGDALQDGDYITDTESPAEITDLITKYAFGTVEGGSNSNTTE